MTSTTRDILWMLKQMRSTIENVEIIDGAEMIHSALADVMAVTIDAIHTFEQAIVNADRETQDETQAT